MKKAQVMLFVIAGIVILLIMGLLLILVPDRAEQQVSRSPIDIYIKACLEKTTKAGAKRIALQGGYFNPPAGSPDFYSVKIPYYWDDGNKMPSIDVLEDELSSYIESAMIGCLDNFSAIRDLGYDVDAETVSADAEISDNRIDVGLDYEITAKLGDTAFSGYRFSASVPSDLGMLYKKAEALMSAQEKMPDSIPWSDAVALGGFEGLLMSNNRYMYTFAEDDLVYAFLARYDWEFDSSGGSFEIEEIPVFYINQSVLISYQVKAEKPAVFSVLSDYFNITDDGHIEFMSDVLPDGENSFLISATDDSGVSAFAVITFIVDMPDLSPVVADIPQQNISLGERFIYDVEASDPSGSFLYFIDDSPLFDIDVLTGRIDFVPEDPGTYYIKVVTVNSYGHTIRDFNLVVT